MIQVNIQDAKTHLSRYIAAVESGEILILCRHNKPVAEIRAVSGDPPAVEQPPKAPRFGLWDGYGVSESFFDSLPGDVLKAFNGQ